MTGRPEWHAGDLKPDTVVITATHSDKLYAKIAQLTKERDELARVLRKAVEWNGVDDEGVPAIWLDEADTVFANLNKTDPET